jgi:hypothetical protein
MAVKPLEQCATTMFMVNPKILNFKTTLLECPSHHKTGLLPCSLQYYSNKEKLHETMDMQLFVHKKNFDTFCSCSDFIGKDEV